MRVQPAFLLFSIVLPLLRIPALTQEATQAPTPATAGHEKLMKDKMKNVKEGDRKRLEP
jgi:hypothetical protein